MPSREAPEGTIIPPDKVRGTIDKTAGYIARNGQQFANRLARESSDKFSFLKPEDPFHKYYLFCLDEYKQTQGHTTHAQNGGAGLVIGATGLKGITSSDDIPAKKESVPGPEPQRFSVELPFINSMDLEALKLVAQFCAANNSEGYLRQLRQHLLKANPSQFVFLKENHRLYPVFQQFVEQYRLCIEPGAELLAKVNAVPDSTTNGSDSELNIVQDYKLTRSILEKAYIRAEHNYKAHNDRLKQQQQEEREKIEYASVNWDDFKIVQVVEFSETDKYSELPLPLSKNDLIYRSLQQKKAGLLLEEAPPDFDVSQQGFRAAPEQPVQSVMPGQTTSLPERPPPPVAPRPNVPRKGMKIKTAGETRLRKSAGTAQQPSPHNAREPFARGSSPSAKLIKSPITGELIPEDKLDMHMRIVLRDPRYEQEKQNYLRKNASAASNLTDAEVFANIKRLRGEQGPEAAAGEQQANKRAKVQWDGYKSSARAAQEAADREMPKEEADRIKRQRHEQENRIGPQL